MKLNLGCTGLAAIALASLTGCSNQLADENKALLQDNELLRQQLAERDTTVATDEAALADANATINADETALAAFEGIDGVTAEMIGDDIHVVIEGDVLFDSGRDEIRPAARKALDKIVSTIQEGYAEQAVRVAGFTDTDPIKKSGWKSNYHLGFARAYAVREYLVGKGLEGKAVSLSSYGPDMPRDTKANSRRVEVILVGNS